MKHILFLAFIVTAVNLQASDYSENWIIEGKVTRVYTAKETAKLLRDQPNISANGATNIGLQITIINCEQMDGRDGTKCSKGMVQDIVLSFFHTKISFTPKENMLLKLRYAYYDKSPDRSIDSHSWFMPKVMHESTK